MLVVDDNPDGAETLTLLLEFFGHEVVTALGGEQALIIARESHFDAILLDIGLPVLDGYEVAKRLRSMPGKSGVRIAALTGYGQLSDRRRAQEAGFDAHFVKPVDRDRLLAFLEERIET